MKITILIAGFPPAYLGGGPIRTITAMLSSADSRHTISVITNNYDLGSTEPLVEFTNRWYHWKTAKVKYLRRGLRGQLEGLREAHISKSDFLYLNSFFSPKMSIPYQWLSLFNKRSRLVIAPRGELDPGALQQKIWKKRAYLAISKLVGITRHSIWHASSALELSNIELALGHKVKSIIRENDTLLPNHSMDALAPSDVLNLVSFSRISPKKNIHVLLSALKSVQERIHLDIIGPAEDAEYLLRCEKIIESLPPNIEVKVLGSVQSEFVLEKLNNYDLMVCPTLAENFGHVIAESLAAACPVMCADVTPWTEILTTGGGMVVEDHNEAGWARSISDYAKKGPNYWYENRNKSRTAYSSWVNNNKDPHLFELLEKLLI